MVSIPLASEPDPGSVRPKPPITCPLATGVRYFSFCSPVPQRWIGVPHSDVCAPIVIEWLASTLASSSDTITEAMRSIPAPPYSSGHGMPNRPSSAILAALAHGNSSRSSSSAATGAISASANSRTMSRSIEMVVFEVEVELGHLGPFRSEPACGRGVRCQGVQKEAGGVIWTPSASSYPAILRLETGPQPSDQIDGRSYLSSHWNPRSSRRVMYSVPSPNPRSELRTGIATDPT